MKENQRKILAELSALKAEIARLNGSPAAAHKEGSQP